MIANTFIKRPVTAIVVSLVLAFIGIICIFNLPVNQYPDITPPVVQVTGQFTGADATQWNKPLPPRLRSRLMAPTAWSTCKATAPITG